MSKYIMGVDGGGTKSHLAIFNEDGKCVCFKSRGPLNHEMMEGSYEELEKVLPEFLLGSLEEAGISPADLAHSVLGLAGVDTKWQHELISGIIEKAGIKNFTLCNDAFIGVTAGCPNGAGICAINGTGFCIAALDHSGNIFQLGGMGVLTDDCGGSTWYSEQVLGTVYNALFRFGKQTLITDLMFAKLGITDKKDYTETLATKLYTEVDFSELNRLVFEAAAKKDEVAMDILKRSAENYAGGIAYLARNMDFPTNKALQIAFAGSIFTKEKVQILPKMVRERVYDLLGRRNPAGKYRLEFNTLDTPPVAGAVLWAAHRASFTIDMRRIKKELPK